jgi:hypothetical protein
MRAGLAFWSGVIGAAVMVLGMWIAQVFGGTGFNFGDWWGSMALGNTTGTAWGLGFIIQLAFGGVVALIFAAVFESLGRSNWLLGLLGGFIFLVIGGFALEGVSAIHPAIPQVIPDPGYFTANYGPASIASFCVLTLIYGIIVGTMYVPLHVRRVVETRREEHLGRIPEEHAVEAGAPRHDERVVGAGAKRTSEHAEEAEETEGDREERYAVSGKKPKPPER